MLNLRTKLGSVLAFLSALHPRLGAASPAKVLPASVAKDICETGWYFVSIPYLRLLVLECYNKGEDLATKTFSLVGVITGTLYSAKDSKYFGELRDSWFSGTC